MGQKHDYNQLYVVTHAKGDNRAELQAEAQRQATRIVDAVEEAGYPLLTFGATLVAVIRPLWQASHLSIREAISDETPRAAAGRAVLNAGSLLVRSAMRGLLRKWLRLFLNLMMLGLAGAMFVTALNVRREVQLSMDRLQKRRDFDISVMLDETVGRRTLEERALKVPGVSDAQGSLMGNIGIILPDGTLAGSVEIQALPANSDYAIWQSVSSPERMAWRRSIGCSTN